jgi:hypothetical protein
MIQQSKSKESFMEKKKVNLPQKDAGRRLADRLEKLGQQKPPKALIEKLNQNDREKVAAQRNSSEDMDI